MSRLYCTVHVVSESLHFLVQNRCDVRWVGVVCIEPNNVEAPTYAPNQLVESLPRSCSNRA